MAYELLDRIRSFSDVRALERGDLAELCGEIRAFLLENVSRTGGHLASNLGIVEISVALARCAEKGDRILYDVGHQCYVHKILSGRKDRFPTLRAFGGMSGFMRPQESPEDPFVTGHASNSVSAALGLARAARLRGEKRWTVAVLGDGALTGGLAYEGLNDAGTSREHLLVLLNDNGMSITENVGALSRYFARFRMRGRYIRAKKKYHILMDRIPGGRRINRFLTRCKNRVKAMILGRTVFEQMGFTYFGPIDGNDVNGMCHALEMARETEGPVFIHAMTRKGLGYAPSENSPEKYHGVSGFELSRGCEEMHGDTFSDVFGRALCELAEKDARICAVTAAMPAGCGLLSFREKYPDRFFDVGIAEEHAVTLSAGLAAGGMRPVFAVYSTFLQRGFDELIHDVAIMKNPVVFAVDRAGLVGADGETHHGLFDIGYLSLVPGMKILLPASFAELRRMLAQALSGDGPVAVRYPRGGEGEYKEDAGEEPLRCMRQGDRAVLLSYGRMWNAAIETADRLSGKGISCALWKLGALPANFAPLRAAAEACGRLYLIEETTAAASVRTACAAELCGRFDVRLFCTGNGFVPQGSTGELLGQAGLDPEHIAAEIERELQ